jgi:hypothetical protein
MQNEEVVALFEVFTEEASRILKRAGQARQSQVAYGHTPDETKLSEPTEP